ncbi:leucine rich repeat protein, bspa family protein [Entamoeba histolytica HM-3:IMSS]|uniref:Leucine rich repeat protein, bspa family protein n=1 Tax=Entamoeba histolytica HM-3:IMSS TaxID=885315 RepID=M7X2A0_ENTHI|nr:leucine rich repeat protein, bspa family protein [Entamoeba histolytica HM-3:IMSS]
MVIHKLDRYHLMVVCKYLQTVEDYLNIILINSKFKEIPAMFHYNPISINKQSKKLFVNIESQFLYSRYDELINGMSKYIVWYGCGLKTVKYYQIYYSLRPIFKRLYLNYTQMKDFHKEEGDVIYFGFSTYVKPIDVVDVSNFYGLSSECFKFNTVNSVILGHHIRELPPFCFDRCGIKQLDLSYITKIEGTQFYDDSLTALTLSKYLEKMDLNAFQECTNLKKITISEGSKEINVDVSYNFYTLLQLNGISCNCNIVNKDFTLFNPLKHKEENTVIDNIVCSETKSLLNLSQQTLIVNGLMSIPFLSIAHRIKSIKEIVLSSDVEIIQPSAFYYLIHLEKINLNSVRKIGSHAFELCQHLKEVDLSNIRSLGMSCFSKCKELMTVKYSTYLTTIPAYSFISCSNLKEIEGLDFVQKYEESCFRHCNKLTINEVFSNLKSIYSYCGSKINVSSLKSSTIHFGPKSFIANTSLQSIHISQLFPRSKILPSKCFALCTNLTSVQIDDIKCLEKGCFANCYSLINLVLPTSLVLIKRLCFSNCTSLKSLEFPSRLKHIQSLSFSKCYSLTRIMFKSSKTKCHQEAFLKCPLKIITFNEGNYFRGTLSYQQHLDLQEIGIKSEHIIYTRHDRRRYGNNIPSCVDIIGTKAFDGCSSEEIVIPSTIKKLDCYCFYHCKKLKRIKIPALLFDSFKQINEEIVQDNQPNSSLLSKIEMMHHPHHQSVTPKLKYSTTISFKSTVIYINNSNEITSIELIKY